MKTKKIISIILLLILIRAIFLYFEDYTFSGAKSIKKLEWHKKHSIEILTEKEFDNRKVLLFKDDVGRIGIARLKNKYGLLWKVIAHTYLERLEENVPFEVVGEHLRNMEEKDQFMIGFHTNDKNIRFVIVGPEKENLEKLLEESNQNLNQFKQKNPQYSIEHVDNGYALIIQDKFQVINWNFYAFDSKGKLIATKIAGTGDARYIEQN